MLSTSVDDSSFSRPESRAGSRSFGSAAGALRVADGAISGWAPRWVGTGSVSVFFSARVIADDSMSVSLGLPSLALLVCRKKGAGERTRGASVLWDGSGECTAGWDPLRYTPERGRLTFAGKLE